MSTFAAARSDRAHPKLRSMVLLVALITAVLCALLPLGPPRTVAIGSAFNPATSVDVLRAGSINYRPTIDRTRARSDDDLTPNTPPVIIAAIPVALKLTRAPLRLRPTGASAVLSALGDFLAFQPRGPPAD